MVIGYLLMVRGARELTPQLSSKTQLSSKDTDGSPMQRLITINN